MAKIPKTEQVRFETMLSAQAQHFGLTPEEYIRKVWYHKAAAELGEYVAMSLANELLECSQTHGDVLTN